MEIFENILEQTTKYNSIQLFFVKNKDNVEFDTQKINKNTIQKIKDYYKNKNKLVSWKQIETSYNNITKIEKIHQNNTNTSYTSKLGANFIFSKNNLLVMENKESVDKDCFPPLSDDSYNIAKKNYEKITFDNFDILFITQNDETIICFDVTNIKKENKNMFKEVYDNVTKIIS